jgi:hypothetical protein
MRELRKRQLRDVEAISPTGQLRRDEHAFHARVDANHSRRWSRERFRRRRTDSRESRRLLTKQHRATKTIRREHLERRPTPTKKWRRMRQAFQPDFLDCGPPWKLIMWHGSIPDSLGRARVNLGKWNVPMNHRKERKRLHVDDIGLHIRISNLPEDKEEPRETTLPQTRQEPAALKI